MCLFGSGCLPKPFDPHGQQLYDADYPSVSQKDSVEAGKILRRLGYEKDKHQRRVNGKKERRMWRRINASGASAPASLPEAGQTSTGGSEVSDPPHVSSPSVEKEQGQQEEQMTGDALLGKTPEAPLGSGLRRARHGRVEYVGHSLKSQRMNKFFSQVKSAGFTRKKT